MEASNSQPMSANDFIELLKSMVPSDRQTSVRFQPSIGGERGGGSVYVNFINLPPGTGHAGGGAEAENNRASFWIEGFKYDPTVPVAKIKVDQSNNIFHGGFRGSPNAPIPFRAKTGSPDAVARYLAAYLAKVVATAQPYYSHTTTRESSRSVRDYVPVDSRGRPLSGPTKDYGEAKGKADQAGGVVKFTTGRPPDMEATKRPSRGHAFQRGGRRAGQMTQDWVMKLADELAREVDAPKPKPIPGGFRYSEKNESAQFTTYSPEYSQKIVVVVSVFEDGSTAINIFSDESLSELDRYENISSFTYAGADTKSMVQDIDWVKKTVDGYAASWQQDQPEVDELPQQRHKKIQWEQVGTSGKGHWYGMGPSGHSHRLIRRSDGWHLLTIDGEYGPFDTVDAGKSEAERQEQIFRRSSTR